MYIQRWKRDTSELGIEFRTKFIKNCIKTSKYWKDISIYKNGKILENQLINSFIKGTLSDDEWKEQGSLQQIIQKQLEFTNEYVNNPDYSDDEDDDKYNNITTTATTTPTYYDDYYYDKY